MEAHMIRAIESMSKRLLAAEVKRWARARGREWIHGGPDVWSKQQLVSAVIRIREGGQP